MNDIQRAVAEQVGFGTSEGNELRDVEAVSVRVLTGDEATALQVAPMLAQRIYGGRFGRVIHAEWVSGEEPGFLVDVERLTNEIVISPIQNNR